MQKDPHNRKSCADLFQLFGNGADDAHRGLFSRLAQRILPEDFQIEIQICIGIGGAENPSADVVQVDDEYQSAVQNFGELCGGLIGLVRCGNDVMVVRGKGEGAGAVHGGGFVAGDFIEPAFLAEQLADSADGRGH